MSPIDGNPRKAFRGRIMKQVDTLMDGAAFTAKCDLRQLAHHKIHNEVARKRAEGVGGEDFKSGYLAGLIKAMEIVNEIKI